MYGLLFRNMSPELANNDRDEKSKTALVDDTSFADFPRDEASAVWSTYTTSSSITEFLMIPYTEMSSNGYSHPYGLLFWLPSDLNVRY